MNTPDLLNQSNYLASRVHPNNRQAIEDHKWFLSERLGRNVGINVAALDYFENVQPSPANETTKGFVSWFLRTLERLAATQAMQHLARVHYPVQATPFGPAFKGVETLGTREHARAA